MNGSISARVAAAVAGGFAASALGCVALLARDATPDHLVLMVLLHVAGAAAALAVLAAQRRALLTTRATLVAQIEAVGQGIFEQQQHRGAAEWEPVQRAVNVMATRLANLLDDRDRRLGELQTEVSIDELTGAMVRTYFIDELAAMLARADADAVGGLVILRIEDLAGFNQRAGRQRADELLKCVATLLRARLPRLRAAGGAVGRLNGSDFALAVPETTPPRLETFVHELESALRGFKQRGLGDRPGVAAVSATVFHAGEPVEEVLARADLGLVGGETRDAALRATIEQPGKALSLGQWRTVLDEALATGRIGLAFSDINAPDGRRDHRQVAARLRHEQLQALEHADMASLALHTGRTADLDLRLVELALASAVRQGVDMAVPIAAASAARPAFVTRLELTLAFPGAERLRIEVEAPADGAAAATLLPLGAALRRCEVPLGLCGIVAPPEDLQPLRRLGVRYLRLAPRMAAGLSGPGSSGKRRLLDLMARIAQDEALELVAPTAACDADQRVLHGLGIACGAPPEAEETASKPAAATHNA